MPRLIRVLHVANAYPPSTGGAAVRMRSVMEPLAEHDDLELHILTVTPPAVEAPTHELMGKLRVTRVNSQRNLPTKIIELNRKHPYDIVHAHNARFALFAEASRRPIFLELHALENTRGIKGLLTRLVCGRAKKVFTLATSASTRMRAEFRIPASKLAELRNGVDIQLFDPSAHDGSTVRSSLGISPTDFVIGYAGTFYDWQGVNLLIQGFAAAKKNGLMNAKLLLVGDGPSFSEDKQTSESLGVSSDVVFTGRVPHKHIPNYMKAMDVFALARPDTVAAATAVPLKVLEAMAMGCCTLVTPVAGLLEVTEPNVTGYTVEGFRPEDISSGILQLLHEPSLRSDIGQAARKEICLYHSWDALAATLADHYRDFVAANGTVSTKQRQRVL